MLWQRPHVIRVAVVSDIRLYRDGLELYLRAQRDVEVVATAASAADGVQSAEQHLPDIILVDLTLPECHAAVRGIRSSAPETRVVVLGLPEAEADFLAWAEAGVAGFVPRESSLGELVAVLDRASRGELIVPPRAAGFLLRRVATLSAASPPPASAVVLTAREAEIAGLLDDGKSNKEIARSLGIEVATVKNHVHHILDKWKLRRRGEIPRAARHFLHRKV